MLMQGVVSEALDRLCNLAAQGIVLVHSMY